MKELVVWLLFLAGAALLLTIDAVAPRGGRMADALLGEITDVERDRAPDPPVDHDPMPVDDPPAEDDPVPGDPPEDVVVIVPDGAIRYVLRDAFLLAFSSVEIEGNPARVLPADDRYDLEVRTTTGTLKLLLDAPREFAFLTELPSTPGGDPRHPALLVRPVAFDLRAELTLERAVPITLVCRLGHDVHPGLLDAVETRDEVGVGRTRVLARSVYALLRRCGVGLPAGGVDEDHVVAVRALDGPSEPGRSRSLRVRLELTPGSGLFAGRRTTEDEPREIRVVGEITAKVGQDDLEATLSLTYVRAER